MVVGLLVPAALMVALRALDLFLLYWYYCHCLVETESRGSPTRMKIERLTPLRPLRAEEGLR